VLAVIGLATVIRSAFGFGEALVAVPSLSCSGAASGELPNGEGKRC
jgi:hypothetical protein